MGILTAFTPQQKKKIVFFGDSITQAGAEPGGYIGRIDSLSKKQCDLVGAGVGGNKVTDLFLRLQPDVLDKKPDLVVIYIGVNDVWHKRLLGTGIDADKFPKFYQAIIDKIKGIGAKIIMVTPAAIGEKTDFSNEQDGDLNNYCNIIRGIAAKNNIPLVDLRKSLLAYNLEHNKDNKDRGILTVDGVHLNGTGNQLVAEEFWKVIAQVMK